MSYNYASFSLVTKHSKSVYTLRCNQLTRHFFNKSCKGSANCRTNNYIIENAKGSDYNVDSKTTFLIDNALK